MTISKFINGPNSCIVTSVLLLVGALGVVAGPGALGIIVALAVAGAFATAVFYGLGRYVVGANDGLILNAVAGIMFSSLWALFTGFWFCMTEPNGANPPTIAISTVHLLIVLAAILALSFCITRKIRAHVDGMPLITFACVSIFTSVAVALVLGIATKWGLIA